LILQCTLQAFPACRSSFYFRLIPEVAVLATYINNGGQTSVPRLKEGIYLLLLLISLQF